MCHETETQLHQQRSSDSCFSLCSLDWNCHRSAERASNRSKAGELWMEFGLQPRDRRQARREHRTGSQLSHMVASRAPCLNRVQGPAHRVCWAHFDNRERQAGMELCIYCDVGFGFRFSPPIWGVVDPRGRVATWLAGETFPRRGNRLREIQSTPIGQKAVPSVTSYLDWFCGAPMENRTIRIRVAVICGLLICAVAITTRTVTIAAANQNSYGAHGVYTTAATPTPTATPCASVGSWTEQAPYPIAIWGHAVASVGGNVYGFGGIVNNTAITYAYKYSPASNTWTPVAPLPEPRAWFSGTTDGTYIYLLGGEDQNFNTTATLWRYDPISNTYNTSLPSYAIPTYFHACAYLNGKIYRIAGRAIGTDFHVEVYDIATNTWSMAANYPFANHSLMAVALGNYIYAGGGNASPNKTWRYDPSTNTWDDAAIADL